MALRELLAEWCTDWWRSFSLWLLLLVDVGRMPLLYYYYHYCFHL